MTSSSAPSPVSTPDAPAAIGPYSQAVRHGGVLYCSGQIPLRPDDGTLVDESLLAATSQCLDNLAAVCAAAGTSLERAVRLTIYTTRLESFAEINEAYAAHLGDVRPARAAIGVAALPLGAEVEVDAVVALG